MINIVPFKFSDILSLDHNNYQWFHPLEILKGFTIMDYKLASPEEISRKLNENEEEVATKESILEEYLLAEPELRSAFAQRGFLKQPNEIIFDFYGSNCL